MAPACDSFGTRVPRPGAHPRGRRRINRVPRRTSAVASAGRGQLGARRPIRRRAGSRRPAGSDRGRARRESRTVRCRPPAASAGRSIGTRSSPTVISDPTSARTIEWQNASAMTSILHLVAGPGNGQRLQFADGGGALPGPAERREVMQPDQPGRGQGHRLGVQGRRRASTNRRSAGSTPHSRGADPVAVVPAQRGEPGVETRRRSGDLPAPAGRAGAPRRAGGASRSAGGGVVARMHGVRWPRGRSPRGASARSASSLTSTCATWPTACTPASVRPATTSRTGSRSSTRRASVSSPATVRRSGWTAHPEKSVPS